jgi:hypothetical protein
LEFGHEVPFRHTVYLRVANICCWGGWRPQDAASRASARASYSCSCIYIGRFLLRFGSFYRVIHSHRQAHLRYFDRDVHPWPFIRASSSSSLASSPGQDSSDNYPDIGASACENSTEDNRLILMVAPNRDRSHNSSSGYPTIGRSEASDAQTRSVGLVQNLIPDFNAVRVQAIMETIQRMAPDGSPLALMAQQGPRRRTSL